VHEMLDPGAIIGVAPHRHTAKARRARPGVTGVVPAQPLRGIDAGMPPPLVG
jgi:hypothetical protein